MRNLSFVCIALLAACTDAGKQDAKGQVDDSDPPAVPFEGGKADSSSKILPLNVQSPHPYANNQTKSFPVALANLPSCANGARLHFKVLRTEAGYDFLTVQPSGESFDGTHDNAWSQWFDVTSGTQVGVRLASDSSITYHGFEIDSYEWRGAPICPAIAWPACGDGTVNIQKTPGTCECPQQPVCAPLASVEVSHQVAAGFNNTMKKVTGSSATYTHPGPADAPETETVGSIDQGKLADLIHRAGQLGLLQGNGYARTIAPGATLDSFKIKAGSFTVTFTAAQGTQDAQVQSLIDDFESLFACGNGGGLTCGSGLTCESGECVEQASCVCPANFDPVCGQNGHTYSNACQAGCANAPVAHNGECGAAGDTCGTMFGLVCQGDNKCRFAPSTFTYPYPDAGGTCVAANYCDAPTDCNGLVHPAVVGQWSCAANACAWQAGAQWKAVTDGHFETAHPYAANTSVWKQLYLPAGAQALRLTVSSFKTEASYDFLEVWTWKNGAWAKDKSYSGTTGPSATDEFPGQYHYLRFVSDSSVNASGVTLDAQWR